MSDTLDQLRKDLKPHTTIMLQGYDEHIADINDAQGMVMTIDNRRAKLQPVPVSTHFVLPEGFNKEDESVLFAEMDQAQWAIPVEIKDTHVPFNLVNMGRANTAEMLADIMAELGPALVDIMLNNLFELFRKNRPAYNGQPFFDKAHPQFGDRGTFSNILDLDTDVDLTSAADPTPEDAYNVIKALRLRFTKNQTLKKKPVFKKFSMPTTIVALTEEWHAAFEAVLEKEEIKIEGVRQENQFKGKFTLLLDENHPNKAQWRFYAFNGGRTKITVRQGQKVRLPGFPSSFLVLDSDPKATAEAHMTRSNFATIGANIIMGLKLGLPHGAIAGWKSGG